MNEKEINMYKMKFMVFKPGMPSPRTPRARGSFGAGPRKSSGVTKAILFFTTLAMFSLAARLVSSPPSNHQEHPIHVPLTPPDQAVRNSPPDQAVNSTPQVHSSEKAVNHYDHAAPVVQHFKDPMPLKNPVPVTVPELIEAIRATAIRASRGVRNKTTLMFTDGMREAWHAQHLCRSRYEILDLYSLRKITKDVTENQRWTSVYEAYENLHRTCVMQMGNVTEFFLESRRIDGCKFVVAGVEPGAGLGNKVLSIVSAMVYAVVTRRILLVPAVTAIPGVFCEPFAGSSWEVDPDKVWSESEGRRDLWLSVKKMFRRIDGRRGRGRIDEQDQFTSIHASATAETWDFQPQPRFFCDTEQAIYSKVDWIGFRNNLYYVPKLFAVPSFRPVLEDLFPDRNVLTHVLRTLMLPCDSVWGRVKQVHDAHLRHADRRVGVQLRYFHGTEEFNAVHQFNEDHVEQCLIQNHFLPDPFKPIMSTSQHHDVDHHVRSMNVTKVLVTSLYQSLFDRLTRDFVRNSLNSGDAVGIVQLTHEGDQFFGQEVDRQALVEILSLSLTDHLVLTPLSTFGALAQGYGGVTPWYIDLRSSTSTPCVRALSPEVCYQIPASKHLLCPHDVAMNGKKISDVVHYVSDCHLVEDPYFKVNGAGLGIQLLVSPDRRIPPPSAMTMKHSSGFRD